MTDLTSREREVVELVAAGMSYQGIAAKLGMAPRTVRIHVAAVDRKIQVEGATPYRRVMRWVLERSAA